LPMQTRRLLARRPLHRDDRGSSSAIATRGVVGLPQVAHCSTQQSGRLVVAPWRLDGLGV